MDPSFDDVSSVPINHKYWDCTVFTHVYVHVCTYTCVNTHTHSGLGVRQWTVIYRLQRLMCNYSYLLADLNITISECADSKASLSHPPCDQWGHTLSHTHTAPSLLMIPTSLQVVEAALWVPQQTNGFYTSAGWTHTHTHTISGGNGQTQPHTHFQAHHMSSTWLFKCGKGNVIKLVKAH